MNGPLLEVLADSCEFHDRAAIHMFRVGGALVGVLPCSGNGKPISQEAKFCLDTMAQEQFGRNSKMLVELREDKHADSLLTMTIEDAGLGRMSMPMNIDPYGHGEFDISEISVSPRFSVEQGCAFCAQYVCCLRT